MTEPTYLRTIPFTQYLRPFGSKRPVTIDRPDRIVDMAQELIQAGYWFEVEELVTGEASFAIRDLNKDVDVDSEVVANGPEVPATVDRMIERFHTKWKTSKQERK